MLKNSNNILAWGIWIFLSIVWGSSFILIKKSLIGLSPMQVALVRIFVAFIAFLPFILKRFKTVDKKYWKTLALIGIVGNAAPAILYAMAQTKVLSASAGILNALTPIFTMIVGIVIFTQKMKGAQIIGAILGFVGAGLLFANGWNLDAINKYTFLIVVATICYALSVNLVGYSIKDTPPLTIASCSFIVIGPLSVIGIATIDPQIWIQAPTSVFYVIILALFSTFLAGILFYKLVHLTDPLFASSVSYFAPVIALIWGFADQEALYFKHLIALVLVLTGVFLIRSVRKA